MISYFEFYQKSVAKKEESDDDFDLFASSDEDKPPSKPSKKQVKQVEIVKKYRLKMIFQFLTQMLHKLLFFL